MVKELNINPVLGDHIIEAITLLTGEPNVHIILVVFPMDGPKLAPPTFITSLQPDEMESALIQIGEGLPNGGPRTVRQSDGTLN
jgi:hypothetical protein